ncbi:hypothetical protein [Isoptericola sp. G70]|uniref:hypothetical protein n=1 Tax=Isoptericola sp. G70 TaxID=3376633 RepID=UPI003A800DEA
MSDIVSRLLERIARVRQRGRGGIGRRLYHVLLAQLTDLVAERGSQNVSQLIDRSDVANILDEPAALLADAIQTRSWGRAHGVPTAAFLSRPAIAGFLTGHLTEEALYGGTPVVAVLRGLSGSGKSAAAAAWAACHRENYAATMWVDAATDQGLADRVPGLLEWLGADRELGDNPAQTLCDALAELPVPWLLVLDGARDHAVTSSWTPVSGYGHVIITTNRGDWPIDIAPLHEIGAMADAEALALIRHRLPAPSPGDDAVVLRFAARLGRWPLAIDLACAWVRGLGGDHARLAEFVSRLDRLDLMADTTPLGSYPKVLSVVVGELWSDLSPQSQVMLGIVVVSGGAHVPRLLLDRWATSLSSNAPLQIDSESAVDELVASSLITRRLLNGAGDVFALDEAIFVHEGIQMVLSRGVGAEVGFIASWLEVLADTVNEFVNGANIVDASALLPVATEVVNSLRAASVLDDEGELALRFILLQATTMMHNLGVVATLTRLFDAASMWLRLAVDIREEVATEDQRTTTGYAAFQIETLAALVQVVLRQDRLEEIQPVVEEALRHLGAWSVDDLEESGVAVGQALGVLAEALQYAPDDSSLQRARIDAALADFAPQGSDSSSLQRQLIRFNDVRERARFYATAEQWSRSVDAVLAAADEAVASGMLEHDAVEAVLDCGLELMHSRLRRLGPLPAGWSAALARILEWGESHDDAFDLSQQARLSILGPLAGENELGLRSVLGQVKGIAGGSRKVDAWVTLGEMVIESIVAAQRSGRLLDSDGLPEGMELIRTVDGGAESLWWPIVAHDEPVLAFAAANAVMFVGSHVLDPLREALVVAGFPDELGTDGQPRRADGWSIRVEDDTLTLESPNGDEWLTIEIDRGDPDHRKWLQAVSRADEVRVLCRDVADVSPEEILATTVQALVAVRRLDQPTTSRARVLTVLRRWGTRGRA